MTTSGNGAAAPAPAAVTITEMMRQRRLSGGVELTPAPATAGSEAGKYRIGIELARGGMGAILDARDENIRRRVAMKVMLAPEQDDDALLRFIEEAQVTGQLEHPNIVPVHELGVRDDGAPYYTMKLVRGLALDTILDDIRAGDAAVIGQYPLRHLLNVFLKAGDAVAFAHSRGVVHRDLKPENIMVGEYGEVLVLDWGLAKLVDQAPGDVPAGARPAPAADAIDSVRQNDDSGVYRTMAGTIMGTPAYMAPEQAYGRVDQIDQRTDVYALGAVLYSILTLRPPVDGPTVNHVLLKVARGEIVDPMTYSSATADSRLHHCPNGRLPAPLAAVAMKALATDPAHRYADVPALQRDIEAWQGGFATVAEEAGLFTQLALLVRRHRTVVGITTAALATVLALAAVFVVRLNGERRAALAAEARAVAVSVRAAPSFRENADKAMTMAQWDAAATALTLAADLDPVRAPSAWLDLGRVRLAQGDYAAARTAFTHAAADPALAGRAELYLDAVARLPEHPDRQDLAQLSTTLKDAGDYLVAGTVFRQARLSREEAKAAADRLLGEVRTWLGDGAYCWVSEDYGMVGMVLSDSRTATNLEVLRNAPLEYLRLTSLRECRDLSALATLPLKRLELVNMPVADLAFAADLELTGLVLWNTPVKDVSPVCKPSLVSLDLGKADIGSLEPLRGLKLTQLWLGQTAVADIAPLTDMPLTQLDLSGTRVTDIGPLAGMPLTHLNLGRTGVTDLTPLAGAPLRELDVFQCPVRDLAPLEGAPLESLNISNCTNVTDLSSLAGMPLKTLTMGGVGAASIEPLRGLKIERLSMQDCSKWDLAVIADMPLTRLMIAGPSITDIAFLRGKPLGELRLVNARIDDRDLEVLRGLPLRVLCLRKCRQVKNLQALADLPLETIDLTQTTVRDLSPLRNCPLTEVAVDVDDIPPADLTWLRAKPLKQVNGKPAAAFWKEYDRRR